MGGEYCALGLFGEPLMLLAVRVKHSQHKGSNMLTL